MYAGIFLYIWIIYILFFSWNKIRENLNINAQNLSFYSTRYYILIFCAIYILNLKENMITFFIMKNYE